MRKSMKLVGILGICIFMNAFAIPSAQAICTSAIPIASVYSVVDQIPQTASVDAMFYAYESDGTGTFAFNNAYPSSSWFLYYSGTYWYTTGDWGQGALINICPPNQFANHTVVIVSADADGATADNDVVAVIYGAPWGSLLAAYNFDEVTDGTGDPFVGCPLGNCGVTAAPMPQVTITGITPGIPVDVNLQWTEPAAFSHGGAGHPQFFAGYNVYYLETNESVPPGNAATPPTSNLASAWSLVDANSFAARGTPGALYNHTVTVNAHSGTDYYMWFALSYVGEGYDTLAGTTVNYGETGFVGRSSANSLTDPTPGAIDLLSFQAVSLKGNAAIKFETGSETNTLGFNILRATKASGGIYTQVNDTLIPAKGNTAMGAKYRYLDNAVRVGKTYFYMLQEVEQNNQKHVYGSVGVTIKAAPLTQSLSNR